MLTVSGVSKTLGDHLVLERISFSLNTGERVGLVGPNGAGKSTLLAVIAGALPADSGSIVLDPRYAIGFLRQGFSDIQNGTLQSLLDGPLGGLLAAADAVDSATSALAGDSDITEALLLALDYATEQFEKAGGYGRLDELQTLLDRFGLTDRSFATALDELSGGEKTRAGLAALLAARPDVLLLDEPTNHLDIGALDWLEDFLRAYRGAVLIVSHDRAFLDRVATGILELDDQTHRLTKYAGNYSDYRSERARAESALADSYLRQQREVARIERDVRAIASHGQQTERETTNDYVRGRAKKVARTAKVRERKLERLLTSEEKIDKPERRWGLSLDFANDAETGRDVIKLDNVSVRFGERTVLQGVNLHIQSGERVALTGPNGSGKSTLIDVICGRLAASSGEVTLGTGVQLGLYAQEQELVDLARSPLEQVRAVGPGDESDARTFLHRFLFTEANVNRPAGQLSYGERARLSLALLVRAGANVLVLDEPLNHLDLEARERFEEALAQFAGTVLIVLHDRYAIARIATRIVELRDGKLADWASIDMDQRPSAGFLPPNTASSKNLK